MTAFTASNTEDFTAAELDILNTAHDALTAKFPGVDTENINDMLTNAWMPTSTTASLVATISARLS